MKVYVGAGGWGYYPSSNEDRLKAYANVFLFVEVNSTFYQIPRDETVTSWRRRVPREFTFSVKCNKAATHRDFLRPVDESFHVLSKMFHVCRLLRSEMLVLQTPPSMKVDKRTIRKVSAFLKSMKIEDIQIFWEARTSWRAETGVKMMQEMVNEGITPVIDLSLEDPIPGLETVYSRLFSHGKLWYTDEVLKKIDDRVVNSNAERVVLTFHGASMYRDAVRYLELNS